MGIDWRSTFRHLLQVLAFCCVVAVFTTMIWPGTGYPHQLVYSLCIGVTIWSVIEFGRYLVDPRHCHRSGSGHGWPRGWRGAALTLAGIGIGYFGGSNVARLLLGDGPGHPERDLLLSLMVTVAAGVVASFYFHARGQAAGLRAAIAAAERDATQARLTLLQSQLEPHMLFNTLANLRVLIALDPPRAQAMLDRLIAFLRATLGASRSAQHSLQAEFDRLDDYLALMSVRMGERLAVEFALPEALRAHPVPPLLLQPLVENAILHGLEPCPEGGRIEISAAAQDGALWLRVRDTGAGLRAGADTAGTRFGLAQVRERLATLYGERAALTLVRAPGGGTCASVRLPLQPVAETARNTELAR